MALFTRLQPDLDRIKPVQVNKATSAVNAEEEQKTHTDVRL